MKKNEIWCSRGTDYKEMTKRLLSRADLAALIRNKQAGTRICIKPNLVTPSPASFGATTHPEVVAGIIEYLQAHDCNDITVAEGSWVGDQTAEAFEYCGYQALAREYGVKLLDTQKESGYAADCAGMELHLCRCVRDFDFLINVPVLKGHCQTKITCALKNMKGLIPNSEKRRFHKLGLHKPIAHLNTAIRQDFIVIDHICGDLDFEEGGNPVVKNCIMAARDPVLTDAYVCHLLGYDVDEIPYVRMAEKLGVGSADLRALRIVDIDSADETIRAAAAQKDTAAANAPADHPQSGREGTEEDEYPQSGLPRGSALPGEQIRSRRVLAVSYAVDEIDSCSACYGSLIPALDRLKAEGMLDRLTDQIAIGQGHRGKTGRIGVGNCTAGFDFCIKGCPPTEEDIYNGLKQYLTKPL